MDGETLRGRLETDESASLSLLGSPRFLRAAAGGDPAPEPLLDAAAESEHAARETFRAWVADESDAEARAAFESVVDQEHDHRERVAAELDGWAPDDGGAGPMHAYLRGRDATVQRIAGGMVGRPLVTLRTHGRLIAFFEGRDGDVAARRADLFRDLRAETAAVLDEGLALLDDRCAGDEDWETVRMVAGYTIRVAGDDTADALRSLEIDPDVEE
ncbi:rubrerythrin family protein [Halobellus rubicundus]|uniref:Rubrerythrin family protein n=1 Tax=Halobellus rubicundus TaxID=2996466 RepID=A0ABD5MD27_9EURY